jgi:hypothetical protein
MARVERGNIDFRPLDNTFFDHARVTANELDGTRLMLNRLCDEGNERRLFKMAEF